MSSRIYYINAQKVIQLQQIEVEAESEEAAAEKYLEIAKSNGIGVDDYEWYTLSKDDLDIEDHGAAK